MTPESSDHRPFALLVTRNFPPLLGGMESVNQHLLEALQPSWRIALCGPAGCSDHVPPGTQVRQSRIRPLYRFLLATLWHTVRLARATRPQWIIAGSGLSAPIAWLAAKLSGAKMAVYLHGLDVVAPSRVYQALWLPFIRRCDLALVNSRNTGAQAREHGVHAASVQVLHPGTDLPTLDPTAARAFREKYGFDERPLLLSVGRLTQRKGLVEFVEKALPAIVHAYPDVVLAIIGGEAKDALHARTGSEQARIEAAASAHGLNANLCFLGRCDDASLRAAYQAANLHVFPVLDLPGDVEGFGMVALESAAHGLATVAFAVGGVPDAVLADRTGVLVEPGNYAQMSAAVLRLLKSPDDAIDIPACREFAQSKAWPAFGERLRLLLGASHAS